MQEFGMIILTALLIGFTFIGYQAGYEKGKKDGVDRGYTEGYRDSEQEWSKQLAFMRVRYGYDPDRGMDPLEACKLYEHEKRA